MTKGTAVATIISVEVEPILASVEVEPSLTWPLTAFACGDGWDEAVWEESWWAEREAMYSDGLLDEYDDYFDGMPW